MKTSKTYASNIFVMIIKWHDQKLIYGEMHLLRLMIGKGYPVGQG